MQDLETILSGYPTVPISLLPTPLHKVSNVSEDLSAELYCKRDDLTGFAFGGNKTRKLDFLIAEALDRGYDALIAVGSFQSNFCRMAAGAGVAYGIEPHLVLGGEEKEKPTGNLLVDHILGAKIHPINTMDWNEWEAYSKNLEDELTAKGRKVYCLPVGGSVPIGILGYIRGFYEIMEDCSRQNIEPDSIFCADGSLGTHAGLLLGKSLFGWNGRIIGISVAQKKQDAVDILKRIIGETADMLRVDPCSDDDIIIDDNYIGEAYGSRTEAASKAITMFAQRDGIFLDEVYTGKAASGMIDYIKKGETDPDRPVLFLHTGGNIELFE